MKPNKITYKIIDMDNGLELKVKHIEGEVGSYVKNWRYKDDRNWRNLPMPESLVFQMEWQTMEENLKLYEVLGRALL